MWGYMSQGDKQNHDGKLALLGRCCPLLELEGVHPRSETSCLDFCWLHQVTFLIRFVLTLFGPQA